MLQILRFASNTTKYILCIYTQKKSCHFACAGRPENNRIYIHIASKIQYYNTLIEELQSKSLSSESISFINSKKYVTYQEIKDVLPFVLRHRLNIVEKKEFFNFINSEVLNKVSFPDEK